MAKQLIALAAICVALPSAAAHAQQASSSAYTVNAQETVSTAGVVTANVSLGPIAQSSGSAPPSYSDSDSVASLSDNASLTTGIGGVTQSLQTAILTSSATGTATGAEATSTVNNLSLSLASNPLLAGLLGLSATTIQSFSQANSVGGLDASGSVTIEGLILTGSLLGGTTINGSLFVNPAPNTILLSIDGLTITLNEQTMLGDGVTSAGISTNAIDIAFNNFALGTGLANGNIILGHSEALASLGAAAVPEPSSWAMMLLGFAAVGMVLRRRRSDEVIPQLA
jgi:hypothetical protein